MGEAGPSGRARWPMPYHRTAGPARSPNPPPPVRSTAQPGTAHGRIEPCAVSWPRARIALRIAGTTGAAHPGPLTRPQHAHPHRPGPALARGAAQAAAPTGLDRGRPVQRPTRSVRLCTSRRAPVADTGNRLIRHPSQHRGGARADVPLECRPGSPSGGVNVARRYRTRLPAPVRFSSPRGHRDSATGPGSPTPTRSPPLPRLRRPPSPHHRHCHNHRRPALRAIRSTERTVPRAHARTLPHRRDATATRRATGAGVSQPTAASPRSSS